MQGTTHLAAGASLGIGLSLLLELPLEQGLTATAIVMVSSVLPDLDTTSSILGKALFPVSWLTKHFIGHRTVFHSVLTWTSVIAVTALAFPESTSYTAALMLGTASHLILDLMNPSGLMLFWPIPIRLGLGICRSGGVIDKALCRIFLMITGCEGVLYILHFLRNYIAEVKK